MDDVRRHLQGPAVEHVEEGARDLELAEIAREAVGRRRRQGDAAAAAGLVEADLAGCGDARLARPFDGDALDLEAAARQAAAGDEIGELLLGEADAVQGQIELDRHGDGRHRPGAGALRKGAAARRQDEAVDVETPPFQLEGDARLVELDGAGAGHAQAGAALPGLDR